MKTECGPLSTNRTRDDSPLADKGLLGYMKEKEGVVAPNERKGHGEVYENKIPKMQFEKKIN